MINDGDGAAPGRLDVTGLLALPPHERRVVQWLLRKGSATTGSVGEHLALTEPMVSALLAGLLSRGIVSCEEVDGEAHWRVRLAIRRPRNSVGTRSGAGNL